MAADLPPSVPEAFSLMTCYNESSIATEKDERVVLKSRSSGDDREDPSVMSRVLCGGWYDHAEVGMTYDQAVRGVERPRELNDLYDAVIRKDRVEAPPTLMSPATVEILSVNDILSDQSDNDDNDDNEDIDDDEDDEDDEGEDQTTAYVKAQKPNTTTILEDTIRQLQAEVQQLESKQRLHDKQRRRPTSASVSTLDNKENVT
uniref:Uncharacterized protein n=1 Tax=Aureoumbra lagunensis TaxID=44058 RepID=A0A7S3JZ50_9STRA|mmetsp:Transcript_3863/g.5389  ORF Transcript_3863/g.5389 Transcript_3863/m.5389 type:complete len:203 (+) Transcript_3863:86-694(+)